ncbi:LITAF-like zinc ribbon domain-containing protein [Cadophora sp. MPI-SDFR-AT-0126]|nr:LITAF-like zinc ribbon domain-containing protein [Leotiomycetes sp. MPI-SDFR-AT-0126]
MMEIDILAGLTWRLGSPHVQESPISSNRNIGPFLLHNPREAINQSLTMSYPQTTTDPNAQYGAHQQQPIAMQSPGIETAPPTYRATTAATGNEKHEYGTEHFQPQQQQQQQTNPQQTFQQGTPHQSFQVGAAPANTGKYQMATPLASLQQGPAPVDCPVCGVREMTRTEFVSGGTTHLSALLCCCCLCLGCIPYLASWFKDCEHKCGSCGALLAVWHRSGRTEVMAHR